MKNEHDHDEQVFTIEIFLHLNTQPLYILQVVTVGPKPYTHKERKI